MYLNAKTKEKIFTKCGLEFGPVMVNWIAIVQKDGLKSSGNRWHSHFTKTITHMGFTLHDMIQRFILGLCIQVSQVRI